MGTITYTDDDNRVLRRTHDPATVGHITIKESAVIGARSASAIQQIAKNMMSARPVALAAGVYAYPNNVNDEMLRQTGPDSYEWRLQVPAPALPTYYGTITLGEPEPRVEASTCIHKLRLSDGHESYTCSQCGHQFHRNSLANLGEKFDPYKSGNNRRLADDFGHLKTKHDDLLRVNAELRRELEVTMRKLYPPKPEPLVGSTWKRRPI